LIAFVCIFGGALIDMGLRLILPEHHLSAESKSVVNLGAGLLKGNWVGELSAMPVISGGTAEIQPPLKLKDAADALLYLGPRDSLISVEAIREEVDGTPYGKELVRRMRVLGFDLPIIPEGKESPQFERPEPGSDSQTVPAPPKNIDAPLPPRPSSR
jgi:hypothetical protein